MAAAAQAATAAAAADVEAALLEVGRVTRKQEACHASSLAAVSKMLQVRHVLYRTTYIVALASTSCCCAVLVTSMCQAKPSP